MKITTVAYGLAFLLPPFFVHSLAEPVIGQRKSFTTTNVQHVVENARDLDNKHRLLQSGTCSNGFPGVERTNNACCHLDCGKCNERKCERRARYRGLTVGDCCPGHILNSGIYCSDAGAAPCIVEDPTPAPVDLPTPAPMDLLTPAPVDSPTPAPMDPPSPAPVNPRTPAPVDPSTTPTDMETLFDLHNYARCLHNANPLVYNEEVADSAQAYAEVLAANCGTFQHSEAEDRNFYGENLFMCWGIPNCYTPESAMYLLYDDEVQADSVLEYGGHATQIVWKATTEVGCAVESCTLDNVPYMYLVCQYSPAGNIIGQYEAQVELRSEQAEETCS